MAGEFKNLRPTSESHEFQQLLRKNGDLEYRARRERDPMAQKFAQGQAAGASNLFELEAMMRGAYDPAQISNAPIVELPGSAVLLTQDGEPLLTEDGQPLLTENA